jgi:sarcosine oxidase subunit beta
LKLVVFDHIPTFEEDSGTLSSECSQHEEATVRDTADVVVIGAGIQGLSAAYHLNRIGIRNVVVVEMETIGAGSSGRSAAMLTLQRITEPTIRLAQFSYREYMAFEEVMGVAPGFQPTGYLIIAGQAIDAKERELAGLRQQLGVRTDILSPEQVQEMLPVVNVEDITIGVWGPDDGIIDPHSIMQGYASNARRLGTEIEEAVRATGIQVAGGKVQAVETTNGVIATPWVVNAAGVQATEVGRWVGIEIPIDNRRRSIFVTGPFPHIPDDTPFVHENGPEWYYRKEGPGVLMGIGTETADTVSWTVNKALLPDLIDAAVHRVPILKEADIMRGWTGMRALSPDGRPIIGPVDDVEGYVNSCGWGGEGVTGAPAGGQLVAEYIFAGQTETLPLKSFLLSRFSD